ncbi:MAG: N-6 DNA methylase, partial [Clostridia bacterium]|nr:N-6 DNA methylase [Clostridia bacterium]
MRAVETENKQMENVLPKNFTNIDQQILGNVMDIFSGIPMDAAGPDQDMPGRVYEYCIARFAEKEGSRGGEYYTPDSIVRTLVSVMKPRSGCSIYDPCCGQGGMLIQSAKYIASYSGDNRTVSFFGQEANPDTWRMAKINMAIHGIDADLGPHPADTFTNDLHPTLQADYILANPPFNDRSCNQEKLTGDARWKYGLPPADNANFAWIQHMIHHLAPEGKIGMVLSDNALSSQRHGESEIRKKIIQDDLIEGIVALPAALFNGMTMPVSLWFITKGKKQAGKILFIDARRMGYMADRRHRDLTDEEIGKIADTFAAFQNGSFQEIRGFCAVASLRDIEKQDYILTPGRYVGTEKQSDTGEPFDQKMARLTSELSDLLAQSHELEEEFRRKLQEIGYEI